MKTINILFKDVVFAVNISAENAFPNRLLKVEFENNPKLLRTIESPVYIEEKKEVLSFIHNDVKNRDQIDLLASFVFGIEDQYYESK